MIWGALFSASIFLLSIFAQCESTTPTPTPTPMPTPTPIATPTPTPTPSPTPVPSVSTPSTVPAPTAVFSKSISIPVSPDCFALNPMTLTTLPFPVGESVWWVTKVYLNPNFQPPTTAPPATPPPKLPSPITTPVNLDNRCFTFIHNEECTAYLISLLVNEDGSMSIKRAVYNTRTNSVACNKLDILTADVNPSIMQFVFGYYGVIDATGILQYAQTTPEDLKLMQSLRLVLVAMAKGREWSLFATCNGAAVLIIMTEQVVAEGRAADFEAEINEAITAMQLNPEKFRNLPVEFTIPIDKFIPSLLPPPTTT